MGIERLTGDPRSKETIEHGHDIRTRASHTRSLAPHTDKNLRCGHPAGGSPDELHSAERFDGQIRLGVDAPDQG